MRSGSSITAFSVFAVFTLIVYYISEGYQAVYHASATGAGVRLLPMILVQVFFLILSSRLIPRIGRFKPFLVIGPCFIASTLSSTVHPKHTFTATKSSWGPVSACACRTPRFRYNSSSNRNPG